MPDEKAAPNTLAEGSPPLEAAGNRVKKKRRNRKRAGSQSGAVGGPPKQEEGQTAQVVKAAGGNLVDEGPWRALAEITLQVEVFCTEVSHVSTRWPAADEIPYKERSKVAKRVKELIERGEIVKRSVERLLYQRGGKPKGSEWKELRAAWRRLQGIDLAQRLQQTLEKLKQIRDRLTEKFSVRVRDRINEDFDRLTEQVVVLRKVGKDVRESLKRTRDANPLSTNLILHLRKLIEAVTEAITGSVDGTSDTWLDTKRFRVLLPKRLERARAVRKSYEKFVRACQEEGKAHLKALERSDEGAAEKMREFLGEVESAIMTIRSTEEFACTAEEAASLGVDQEIAAEAGELRRALDEARLDFTELEEMVARYRYLLELAPFKRVEASRPLTPWARLSEDYRNILAVLIHQRQVDGNGRMYFMTRQAIERQLGCRANAKSLNRRLLALDEAYEIVGTYQPIRSAERQNPACNHWIEEYAFAFYGSHVLGDAFVPPERE